MSRIDWPGLHESGSFNFLTIPLGLMSVLYGAGVRLRLKTAALKKKRELPGFVISIGNLTAGGTGKTPAVIMLAEWAAKQEYRAAVLSRGYGGSYNSEVFIVSDGIKIRGRPEETGDEPYLMALGLKGVPVIVSRDRYKAGMTACSEFQTNFFILDDGFQHIRLARDMDIVLMDTRSPFGNGHLLPLGPLREPPGSLKRADAVIFTRSGGRTADDRHKEPLRGIPQFSGDHIPEKIVMPFQHEDVSIEELKGKRVIAFAGIARPAAFRDTLSGLGAEILSFRSFPDHHFFTENEIDELKREKQRLKADIIITTEKDWVKVKAKASETDGIAYLAVSFDITPGRKAFFDMVKKKAEDKLHGQLQRNRA